MQMREKVGKSRNTVFFQWFVVPEGRKVGSLKRRVRSQLARGEMKNCTPLWREAHFEVKMYKTRHCRTTFGSWDVKKVHAVGARSTFRSQNVQSTPLLDHFWKLRCRKSARRCGAKHISKSKCTKHTTFGPLFDVEMSKKCTPLWREAHFEVKMYKTPRSDHFSTLRCQKSARRWSAKQMSESECTKHTIVGPLLEVEMSKKCTPLWREAHFQVKMYKTHHVRTPFRRWDVEKVHAVVARSTFPSQKCKKLKGTEHFWTFRCRFAWRWLCTWSKVRKTWGFCSNFKYNHHCTTLHSNTLHYNYNYTFTTFQYTTLHYTTLHSITLNYTTLRYTTLHYNTLHYTTLHYTTFHALHYITLHFTTLDNTTTTTTQLHSTTLHYTPLHFTPLHSTTLHYTKLHYTTLQYTTLRSTTLHYTTLHYTTLHYLPLHFTTLHYSPLHYNYNYNYTTTLHYTTLNYTTLHYIPLHSTTLHNTTLHYTTLHYAEWHCTTDRQVDRQTDR